MIIKKLLFAAILISVLPLCAYAEGLNYNYVQVVYFTSNYDVDGTNIDGDGVNVSGSVGLSDNLAFGASFESESVDSFDYFGYDVNFQSLVFGVGLHSPINNTTDAILSFNVLNAEISSPSFATSEDDTGNIMSVGIRSKLENNVEVGASFSRTEIFDDSSTGFSLSLLIGAQNSMQFGIGYGNSEDMDTVAFGIRANF